MRSALGLVVLLAALLCVGTAQAATWNGTTVTLGEDGGLIAYYDFNCTGWMKDRSSNNIDLGILEGAAPTCRPDWNSTANQAIEFTGTNSYKNTTKVPTAFTDNGAITVITMLKMTSFNQNGVFAIGSGGDATTAAFGAFALGGDGISFGRLGGATDIVEYKNAAIPTAGYKFIWRCFAFWYNGTDTGSPSSQYAVYLDGEVKSMSNEFSNGNPGYDDVQLTLGAYDGIGTGNFVGNMSFLAIYNRSLSRTEQLALCDNFDPYAEDAASGYNNITIHLDNVYNSTFIQEFSVNIGNSTWNRSYDVTDGALSLNISWGYWLNFTSPIFYPHNVYINATSGGVFSGSTYQAILTVIASEFMSNLSLSAFNATVGSVTNTTTNGSTRFFVDAGTYLPIVAAPGYWPGTWIPVTVAAQGFETANASLYSSYITVKATGISGAAISTITLNVTWLNYTYFSSNSANNGSVHFYLINGTYNVSFESPGYNPTSALLTATSYNHTIHFTDIYQLNTVNITYKFQVNMSRIDQRTIFSEFSSTLYSYQWNTSNGTLFKSLVSPESYQIYSYGLGLTPVYAQFTLANETYNEFSIYMADNTSLTACTVTVVDQNSQRVEGAEIRVLRYDVASNSYFQVDAPKTNFNGEAILNLILYNQYYKFQILLDGVILKTTLPGVITSCPFNIQIQTGEISTGTFFQDQGIAYTLNYTTSSQNFNFEYADLTGTTTSGCLAVYVWNKDGKTMYNSTCAASASGNLLVNAPQVNGTTYIAYGYVIYGGNYHFLASLVKSWGTFVDTGIMGYFLLFCMGALFVLLGIHSPAIALIGMPVAMILATVSGISPFPISISITWMVMVILLVVVMNRRTQA